MFVLTVRSAAPSYTRYMVRVFLCMSYLVGFTIESSVMLHCKQDYDTDGQSTSPRNDAGPNLFRYGDGPIFHTS